jgi:hypothetical protein
MSCSLWSRPFALTPLDRFPSQPPLDAVNIHSGALDFPRKLLHYVVRCPLTSAHFAHMTKDDELKTESVSYRMPRKLKDALQGLADADKRKLGPYIQLVLEEHVEAKKKQDGKRR